MFCQLWMQAFRERINAWLRRHGFPQIQRLSGYHRGDGPRVSLGNLRLVDSVVCDLLHRFVIEPSQFWEDSKGSSTAFNDYNIWATPWPLYRHMENLFLAEASMSQLRETRDWTVKFANEIGLLRRHPSHVERFEVLRRHP